VDRRPEVKSYFAAAADAEPGADRHVLCPASVVPLLAAAGEVTELDRADHLRRTEKDPVVFGAIAAGGEVTGRSHVWYTAPPEPRSGGSTIA
jgi:hypothetical protein